jgi:hypothetical protein
MSHGRFYGICEKCGKPVEDPEQPAFPIRGWELGRAGGGANAIRLRERVPDRVRHATCLPHPKQSEQQGSMF